VIVPIVSSENTKKINNSIAECVLPLNGKYYRPVQKVLAEITGSIQSDL